MYSWFFNLRVQWKIYSFYLCKLHTELMVRKLWIFLSRCGFFNSKPSQFWRRRLWTISSITLLAILKRSREKSTTFTKETMANTTWAWFRLRYAPFNLPCKFLDNAFSGKREKPDRLYGSRSSIPLVKCISIEMKTSELQNRSKLYLHPSFALVDTALILVLSFYKNIKPCKDSRSKKA